MLNKTIDELVCVCITNSNYERQDIAFLQL
jgi:hypothetical protein